MTREGYARFFPTCRPPPGVTTVTTIYEASDITGDGFKLAVWNWHLKRLADDRADILTICFHPAVRGLSFVFFPSFLPVHGWCCDAGKSTEPPVITACWMSVRKRRERGEEREQIKDKWTLLKRVRVAITLSSFGVEWSLASVTAERCLWHAEMLKLDTSMQGEKKTCETLLHSHSVF